MGNTYDSIIMTITEGDFTYIIRYSKPEDFEHVFEIWYENQKYSTGRIELIDKELLRERFYTQFSNQDNNFKFWLAEFEGKIIGYQSTNIISTNPITYNEQAEYSIYIKEQFWNKKVGTNLMVCCLTNLPFTEIKRLVGKVSCNNKFSARIGDNSNWIYVGNIPETIKEPKIPELLFYIYNVPNI